MRSAPSRRNAPSAVLSLRIVASVVEFITHTAPWRSGAVIGLMWAGIAGYLKARTGAVWAARGPIAARRYR